MLELNIRLPTETWLFIGRFLADRFVEGTCPKCGASVSFLRDLPCLLDILIPPTPPLTHLLFTRLVQGARGDQCDACCQTLDAIDLIDKKCKICSHTPISRQSKHLYLDLPKLQKDIESWYLSAKEGKHWSANGKAFTEAWLKGGLKERCLTRDLKWGVPVPLDGWRDKVMYVWVSKHLCKFTVPLLPWAVLGSHMTTVWCADRISQYHGKLYSRLAKVVEKSGRGNAVSIHGQRQWLVCIILQCIFIFHFDKSFIVFNSFAS